MTHTSQVLEDSRIELRVALDEADIARSVEKAKKAVTKEVHLDGFRKGKTPKEMVERVLAEKIKEEALQIAVSESLSEIIAKEELHVINQKDFTIEKNEPSELVYKVTLSTFPKIKLGQYKDLTIKKNVIAVTDADIDGALAELSKLRMVTQPVDRPAQTNDKVLIDFTIKEDGHIIEGGKNESYPVVIGEGRFVKGFEEAIIGMKPGESKQFSITIPEDFYQTTIAGKQLDCEVFLGKVEEQKLPILNDEFAKTLGNFASMNILRAHIEQGLLAEKENKERERVRQEMLKKIADGSTFETPGYLVEAQLDGMIKDFDEELHSKGMELGLYLAQIKKTQDELRQDWRPKAELTVRVDIVMRTLAEVEHITVDNEEAEKQAQEIIGHYTTQQSQESMAQALQNIDLDALRQRVYVSILNNKILEFLEANVHLS